MTCHLVLAFILSLSSLAFGQSAINTNLNTTTASNISNQTAGSYILYYSNIGGNDGAGNWTGAAGGACNTALNPRCLTPTQPFTINVTDSVAVTGSGTFWIVAPTNGVAPTAGTTPISTYNPLGSTAYTSNNTWTNVTVSTYATICGTLSGTNTSIDSNCNQTTTGNAPPVPLTLYLIADANGNGLIDTGESVTPFTLQIQSAIPQQSAIATQVGFYNWEAFPGDGEVLIKNPLNTIAGFYSARFYYVTGPDVYTAFNINTFDSISGATIPGTVVAGTQFIDIPLNSDGSFSTYYLTGLSNGTNYYFRAALVDGAGNIGYLTQPTDDDPPDPDSTSSVTLHMHAAQPNEIAGLISKNGNCFIATVTYGSPMAKEVQIFRRFRDEILEKTEAGKRFIHWYYHHGAIFAENIRANETAKTMARGALLPALGFSWLALSWGVNNACLFTATLFLLPLLLLRFWRSRKKEAA